MNIGHEIRKSHLVGAIPTQAKRSQQPGSEPYSRPGNGSVGAWGSERVSRMCRPRNFDLSGAQGAYFLEGRNPWRRFGKPRGTGGVVGSGALEEDGPVTWDTLAVLEGRPGAGDPVNKAPAQCPLTDARALGAAVAWRLKEQASSSRLARQGKTGDVKVCKPARSEGVRWPHKSKDGG
jgi:hypothetical protein